MARLLKQESKKEKQNIEKAAFELGTDCIDPFYFEQFCGSCDNFPGSEFAYRECPFKDTVTEDTEWKKLRCQYYDN